MRTSTFAAIVVVVAAASPALAYPPKKGPFESGVALRKDFNNQHYRAAVDRSHKHGAQCGEGHSQSPATGAHSARNFDLQELYARTGGMINSAHKHHVAVNPSVNAPSRNAPTDHRRIRDLEGLLARSFYDWLD